MEETGKQVYLRERIQQWNRIVKQTDDSKGIASFYYQMLKKYYRFYIPPGLKILELGCGSGDLLASLKPAFGVGVDISDEMVKYAASKYKDIHFIQSNAQDVHFKQKFDVIILSDLINDLWDVQMVFDNLNHLTHAKTRIIINYFNNMWRIPVSLARKLGVIPTVKEQNWLAPDDVENLLSLAGFEVINRRSCILFPFYIKYLSCFLNQFMVYFFLFKWFAFTNFVVVRPKAKGIIQPSEELPSVSIVIPARNEAGHIDEIIRRTPCFGKHTEIIFVEGNSTDNTYETIAENIRKRNDRDYLLFKQNGKGKGDAVRLGFEKASGDILIILDADMTVPPESLSRFYHLLASGTAEFVNGVRLVYPIEDGAMRVFNIIGNKFFSVAFSWLLGQPIKDTLCGTKVLWRMDYRRIVANRHYFGDFDPFGDFDLIFGAAKLNLKITDMPIRYKARVYGDTNISRWSHGWLLLKMVVFAAKRIKLI